MYSTLIILILLKRIGVELFWYITVCQFVLRIVGMNVFHCERVWCSPKFTQSGALTTGSLMFSMEVCAQIVDGVMYFRRWWILSSLTVWSAEINLYHVELLRPSTVCPQEADLCHFFLSVSFFSSYNPDHVNINRDVQRVEMVPLHKGKEILLPQKMAPFQQSSQKDSLHLFLFKLSIPATHTVHIQHGGWQYYNVVHRVIQEIFEYVLLMCLFILWNVLSRPSLKSCLCWIWDLSLLKSLWIEK